MTVPERIWAWTSGQAAGIFDTSFHETPGSATEYVRADLAAVPAQVRVKPLVFDDLGIASDNLLNETIVYRKPEDQDRHNAKRAARILAAIEPQPDPRDAVIARMAEALRNIAEGNLGDAAWQANYARIKDVARAALAAAKEMHN